MPVDTAQKRYSMLGLAAPARRLLPPPDGGFGTQDDRQQLAYMYSGIPAANPIPVLADEGRIVGAERARVQGAAPRARRQIVGSPARRQISSPRGPR